MPLSRLVLILVLVVAAAAVTVWIGALVAAAVQHPLVGISAAVPAALIAYVIARVIWDRLGSAEDRHYDRIEK